MNNKKHIRQNFRDICFKRDKNTCKCCPSKIELTVHHITDRNEIVNGGYVKENGITVCPECHVKAEQFHITGGQESYDGMSPTDLYEMIDSSKEKAVAASERL